MSEAQALAAEDYTQLFDMLTSGDATIRDQGQGLAAKLTPREQQEFFTFQQQAHRGKDATSGRADSNIASGLPGIGSVSPELLLGGVQAARSVGGAVAGGTGMAGRALAGAKQMISEASPFVKYEASRTLLEHYGVPPGMAAIAAAAISGYKIKAAPAAEQTIAQGIDEAVAAGKLRRAADTPVLRARLDTSQMNAEPVASASLAASAPVAQAPPAAATVGTAAPPPPSGSAPSALPDQKALNEAALAARRAAYQARAAKETAPAAPTKFVPTPAEMQEYMRLIRAGKSHAEAGRAIVAMREMQTQYGLTTPTVDETRFPKGMRGKPPQ